MRAVVCLVAALSVAGCGRFGLSVYQEGITEDGGEGDVGGHDSSTEDGGERDADQGGEPSSGSFVTANLIEGTETQGELPRVEGFATAGTPMEAAVSFPAAVGVGERIYIAGGSFGLGPTTCSEVLQEYDPVTGAIDVVRTLPFMNQGLTLLRRRAGGIYLVMGYCGSSDTEEARTYEYVEGVDGLTEVGSLVEGAYYFGGGLLQNDAGEDLIVAAAGYGSGPLFDWVQYLNVETGTNGTMSMRFPTMRCLMASAVADGVLYVFGGYTWTGDHCALDRTLEYGELITDIVAVEVASPRLETVGHLPEPLAGSCAVTRPDGTIILFGGHRYEDEGGSLTLQPVSTVYTFDPSRNEVEAHAALLPTARTGMGCAMTDSGQIYLFGGAGPGLAPIDEILIFEPFAPVSTLGGAAVDSEATGTEWTDVEVVTDIPEGTSIVLSLRVSDEITRSPDDPVGWITIGLDGSLPQGSMTGRYLEWKAELSSSDPLVSPKLEHLSFSYTVQ